MKGWVQRELMALTVCIERDSFKVMWGIARHLIEYDAVTVVTAVRREGRA